MTKTGFSIFLWIVSIIMAVIGMGVMIVGAMDAEATAVSIASNSALGVGLACIPYVVARSFDMICERQADREKGWTKVDPPSTASSSG